MTGNDVSVVAPSDDLAYRYRKGCIAFDAVPEQKLDVWEFPPGYQPPPRDAIDDDTDGSFDLLPHMCKEFENAAAHWMIVIFNTGVPKDRLFGATLVALEGLGGTSGDPIDEKQRNLATRPRSKFSLRFDYQRAKLGVYAFVAVAGSLMLAYFLGILLVMLAIFPFLFAAACIYQIRKGWRSAE
ncbi:MAG: hypothetical protein H6818_20970 [Phycisphaerales bacterium]|nr:hypothetical protein [Phycisphaerales bacterium]MCB9862264.1 hypothetical protein [Phycisphaerales bacterium]